MKKETHFIILYIAFATVATLVYSFLGIELSTTESLLLQIHSLLFAGILVILDEK